MGCNYYGREQEIRMQYLGNDHNVLDKLPKRLPASQQAVQQPVGCVRSSNETWIPSPSAPVSQENCLGFSGVSLHVYESASTEKCRNCDFLITSDAIEFVLCTSGHLLVDGSCPTSFVADSGKRGARVGDSGVSFSLSKGEGIVSSMQHTCGRAFVEEGEPFQAVVLRLDRRVVPELEKVTQCPFLKRLLHFSHNSSDVLCEKISLPLSLQVTVHQIASKVPSGGLRDIYLACKKVEVLYLLLKYFSLSLGGDVQENLPVTQGEKEAASKVYKKISSDFTAVPSLDELAHAVGLNKGRLNTVFRTLYGKTVFEIMRYERLEYSKKLLEQGEKNMTEITYLCGFSSPSHFTKSFTSAFGTTPKKYQAGSLR